MPVEKRAIRAIVLFCLGVGFVIGFLWLAYTTKPDQTEWFVPGMVVPEGIVIYYGESCPHCRILEGYIADNDVMSKVHIVQKEVSLNETNAAEMRSWAVKCGIKDYVGVPFLVTDGVCVMGDKSCISFLKNKTGGS